MFFHSYRHIFTSRARLVERFYRRYYLHAPVCTYPDSRSYHDHTLYFHGGDLSGIAIPTMFPVPDVRQIGRAHV